MSKVVRSELNNNTYKIKLDRCYTKLNSLKTSLNSFNTESTEKLVGGGYDAIRIKLDLYITILDKLISTINSLNSNIQNTNNKMKNYMDGYETLDDSKLSSIKSNLNNVTSYINYLETEQNKEDSNIDYSREITYWKNTKVELNELVELLENLSSTDSTLYSSYESLLTDIDNLVKACNGVNESTFTSDGMAAFASGKGYIYQLEEPEPEINLTDVYSWHSFDNYNAWYGDNIYAQCGIYGQCTSFAAGFFYEIYGYAPGFHGNGCDCAYQLVSAHPESFEITTTPTAGSVFSFQPSGSHQYGHVGIVLDVDYDSGTITYVDGNYNGYTDSSWSAASNDWGVQTRSLSSFGAGYGGVVYANPIN